MAKQTTVHTIGGKTELSYFTAEGVDITEKVRKGNTELFDCWRQADQKAAEMKSYKYDVFGKNGQWLCYGVPK